jgi:hypothetical protein
LGASPAPPGTGLSGAPLSLRPRLRRGCSAPLQSLARGFTAAAWCGILEEKEVAILGLFDIFKKKAVAISADVAQPEVRQGDKEQSPASVLSIKTMPSSEDGVTPAEERIENAIPSIHGLYPHEILVLDYAHSFDTGDTGADSFQGFWWYQYGVKSVPDVIKSLLDRGFLKIGDLKSALEKETVAALKDVLKNHNLKTNGKKEELIQRVLAEIPQDELNAQFSRRKYQLTDIGKEALDAEEYVTYIHRQSIEDLDIWSLNKLVHTEPHMPYRDKIWGYLSHRSVKHAMEGQYGLYRNCKYSMSRLLTQKERLKECLALLVEVAFYDIADAKHHGWEDFMPPPGVIGDIIYCQEELDYSDEDLKTVLLELSQDISVPKQRFSCKQGVNIILKAVKDSRDEDTKWEKASAESAEVVLKTVQQIMLDFLAANQPILQKDFLPAFREANPDPWPKVSTAVGFTLQGIFNSLLEEGKIRREKAGRSFNLFVNI